MDDIVEKLRATADDTDAVENSSVAYLLEEAAAEIERLRRLSANGDCPAPDNAANRDNTPATHATPTEGTEQNWCTLTDTEREAVEWYSGLTGATRPAGARSTLRNLLDRMA